jgi:hypothetical protein
MAASPAASRLNIVSIRATGIINAIWALLVIALGTIVIPRGGAASALLILFAAHMLSVCLVLLLLRKRGLAHAGVLSVNVTALFTASVLVALAWARGSDPSHSPMISLAVLATTAVALAIVFRSLPPGVNLAQLLPFRLSANSASSARA